MTTLHGRLDTPGLAALYREFSEQPLVSISNAQRGPMASANWLATVYHGLPHELFHPVYESGRYLAFLGKPACAAFLNQRELAWGRQSATFGGAAVWVLPNPSGLNCAFTLDMLTTAYKELYAAAAK